MPRRPVVSVSRLAILALALSACRSPDCSSEANAASGDLANPAIAVGGLIIIGIIVMLSLRQRVGSIVLGAIGIFVGTILFAGSSCAAVLASSRSADSRATVAMVVSILCLAFGIVGLVRGVGSIDKKRPPPRDNDSPHWADAYRDPPD